MADFNYANVTPIPFKSGGTIAINRAVKQDTTQDRAVLQAAAASDVVLGFATEAGTSSNFIGVQAFGIAKAEAGAAISRGDQLTVDASGRVITAVTGNNTCAKALMAAGAAGDIIEVLVNAVNTNGPTTP
jgi:hypothetical protein